MFLTVDVETWCGGWRHLDARFPAAFRRYVYGDTPEGSYGLPYMLKLLGDYGLRAVFFTEALFALRFGAGPLAEIADLIRKAGQEIQLHLHTEWVDEARPPILSGVDRKRQYLWEFDLEDQVALIATGIALLREAGASSINAFRAGSYGLNRDTLRALHRNNLRYDSSYNQLRFGAQEPLSQNGMTTQPARIGQVYEIPVTVFRDGLGRWRPLQVNSCAFEEMRDVLWEAAGNDWGSVVIVSHNFELMTEAQDRADRIVARRFRRLCEFLDRHRDSFQTTGFLDLAPFEVSPRAAALSARTSSTVIRFAEQAWRGGRA